MLFKSTLHIFTFLLLFGLLTCSYGKLLAGEPNKSVPVIELKGSGYEKGLQHGRQLKTEIAQVYRKWKDNIVFFHKRDPDSVLAEFLRSVDFEPAIRKYTPDAWEELKGIADGSGQSFNDVYAFQLVDEFWVYLDKKYNTLNHHCSAVGIASTPNHPAYIAQNIDLEGYMNGYQVLFHIAASADAPEQYIVSCAGMIAFSGMNSKAVGLCLNSLMELNASENGLPVAFIIKGILDKHDGRSALEFLQTVKHASGQNYVMGIADSVYDFEASANRVVRFIPATNSMVVYHTNHSMENHDVKDWYKQYHDQVLMGVTAGMNSESRYTSLKTQFNTDPANISEDLIKTTLKQKSGLNPVCRIFYDPRRGFTFSSVIYTLTGKRSVKVTYGSPDQSEYREYFFKE